jgi:hypothetical protein
MDRKQVDTFIPMAYGLVVVICALWIHAALLPVVIIGAFLLGIYYAVFRSKMIRASGSGRERNRPL